MRHRQDTGGRHLKEATGTALAGLLVIGSVIAVIFGSRLAPHPTAAQTPVTVVRGAVGSEKEAFFRDPQVKAAFAKKGLDVQVTPVGSRDIAGLPDLDTYDFAFPSSVCLCSE